MAKENIQGKVMPNNYEAERALLGAILIDKDVAMEIVSLISIDDFYYEPHQIIYEAILEINRSGRPVDIISVGDKLEKTGKISKIGGIVYLTDLSMILPSAANFGYYADIIERDGLLRRLITGGRKIIEGAYGEEDSMRALGNAEKIIFDISRQNDNNSLTHVTESASEVIKKFEGIMADKDSNKGLKSGFENLDSITNGFLPAQMIVLAARPGCGKTSYAMNIVANIAQSTPYKKIAVFNLEMSSTELTQRLVCTIAEVPMTKALKGALSNSEFQKLWAAKKILDESNIFIDDSALITPEQIMSKCRKLAQTKGGLDLIVIDYLQLLTSSRRMDSKQSEVSDISRSIKVMSKELKVPVLILSQMSRSIESDQRKDKRPKLSDLRESGAIEQDADMVFFLEKDKDGDEDGTKKYIELIIAKHRNGPCAEMLYEWDGSCVKFTSVSKYEKYNKDKSDATIVTQSTGGLIKAAADDNLNLKNQMISNDESTVVDKELSDEVHQEISKIVSQVRDYGEPIAPPETQFSQSINELLSDIGINVPKKPRNLSEEE